MSIAFQRCTFFFLISCYYILHWSEPFIGGVEESLPSEWRRVLWNGQGSLHLVSLLFFCGWYPAIHSCPSWIGDNIIRAFSEWYHWVFFWWAGFGPLFCFSPALYSGVCYDSRKGSSACMPHQIEREGQIQQWTDRQGSFPKRRDERRSSSLV